MPAKLKIVPRPSSERGSADHGWLKTFYTFSFAMYQDRNHEQFGSLRVINEDRVAARTGFGNHPHREFEIFSYIVKGELQHKDSLGNTEILKRGDLQLTSAGTGISHSEKAHGNKEVHFLQMWSLPSKSKLTPAYFTRHFTDKEKKDNWVRIVAPVGSDGVSTKREDSGPTPIQSPLTLYSTLLSPAKALTHTIPTGVSKGYIHVIQTSGYNSEAAKGGSIRVSGDGVEHVLKEGDGAYLFTSAGKELTVENVGASVAEVLLFDLE